MLCSGVVFIYLGQEWLNAPITTPFSFVLIFSFLSFGCEKTAYGEDTTIRTGLKDTVAFRKKVNFGCTHTAST